MFVCEIKFTCTKSYAQSSLFYYVCFKSQVKESSLLFYCIALHMKAKCDKKPRWLNCREYIRFERSDLF